LGWLALLPPLVTLPLAPAWVVDALQALAWTLLAYTAYATLLAAVGLCVRPQRRRQPPAKRFAIVIPAHNERLVIGHLLESCWAQRYPRHLYDVFVVADNCSDDTAEVARAHRARVIERQSHDRRGKGYALEDAFAVVLGGRRRYDAVVVFDADNLVHPDFLSVMNAELLAGRHIIQGRPDVKNPDDTWVAATFGMCFWVSNRFWFLAKQHLGFSAALGGTGMCISTEVLRRIGWSASTLTEDLEFSARALLHGYPTYWAHDAVVYDEKPLTFAQSWRQRLRWAQGQTQVAAGYLGRLLWEGLRRRDPVRLEGAVALFQPFYVILSSLLLAVGPVLGRLWYIPVQGLHGWAWLCLALVNYLLPAAAVLRDRLPRRPLRFLALYPVFLLSAVPLTWGGVLSARNRRWVHTRHTRAIRYADLVQIRGAG
jgi:cellulose synthase/poly-beta-1,6-N-acetylglucosamine synthase-like glycosyltransferase